MLYKKVTLASSQHYPMTLKTITPQHCPLATRNAAQKINIGIKSTLSNDSENKNSITTRKVTQKINIGVKSTLSTDLENNNINAPSKQEKLHKKLTLALGCFTLHLFFELSLVLLTTHAIGLYEVTKKKSAL